MNNFNLKLKQKLQNKGFAMLFAVLTSSLVLSIGLSIFNLTLKELALSSIGRESQFAFYAADSGAECVMYWDFNAALFAFATSTNSNGGWRDAAINAAAPTCAGGSISANMITPVSTSGTSPGPSTGVSTFTMNFNPEGYCAIVTITKSYDAGGIVTTSIDSRGYNTCVAADTSRVERALRISY